MTVQPHAVIVEFGTLRADATNGALGVALREAQQPVRMTFGPR